MFYILEKAFDKNCKEDDTVGIMEDEYTTKNRKCNDGSLCGNKI